MMNEFTLKADFGMTATDNGFKLFGINAGDVIAFESCKDVPANGSLVAVSVDNGPTTLKRISYYGDGMDCYLEGGSGKVAPIFISAAECSSMKIIGVAVSVIHSLIPDAEKGA